MTTTIGQQLAPYIQEKPKEEEAVPCDMKRWWWRTPGPADHDDCPSEATHTGICSVGCCTVNACERCVKNHALSYGYRNAAIGISEYVPFTRRGMSSHMGKEISWFPR
jgi:hypothetical protein